MAYILAVGARAGYQVVKPPLDFDSVDGILMGDEGQRPRIEFQAKATSQDVLKDDYIHFPLPKKNYDDLRAEVVLPRILIVVVLPADEKEWLLQTEDALVLKRCGYWMALAGSPESDNNTSVTVKIPRGQVFDPEQLGAMMDRMQKGQAI